MLYHSGYVRVIRAEQFGDTDTLQFRLARTPGPSGNETEWGGGDILDLPHVGKTFFLRFDDRIAMSLVMASLLEEAMIHQLHVAVGYELIDGGWEDKPIVVDIRVVTEGGRFPEEFHSGAEPGPAPRPR